ncbi:MAG: hypothetical protein SCM11_02670 [Bacillota bacterium]|nr:hypothetical protein [Bacillota bacterium]
MKRKRGSALITMVVVFSVLMILGTVVLAIALTETRQVVFQANQIKANYAARAGADAVAAYLIENTHELDTFILKTKNSPVTGSIEDRDFEVYVYGTEHEFIIESIAYKDNNQEAKIFLTVREYNLLDSAIFADEVLITGNNVTINGDIGTNASNIQFGNIPINGNITLGPGAQPSDIAAAENNLIGDHIVDVLNEPLVMPPIDEDQFETSLPSGTTTIDTTGQLNSDGKLFRKIDKIDIAGNTIFYVSGGGDVHLLVTDKINVGGFAAIGTDSSTRLFIYYPKSDTIVYNGTPNSSVTIYAPDATILFNGGGNSEHYGSFICKTFDGPSSNCTITKGTGSMSDLMIEGVAGYFRAVWSK